jgi:hypothetical protein
MLGDDDVSTVIPVDAILFTATSGDGPARGSESDEDDQPIAATLHALPKTGSAQVPAKKKRKMPKKKLYFYEEVAEPTGIASKYWDAPAPSERATKVLANEAAASRNKTFMASQSPSWHARTSQERRADLQSFMASQRRMDKAASAAQVPIALITTSSTMLDTSVVKAVPAKEPGIHLGKNVALDMDKDDSGQYEQLRAENIARNNVILSGLGFEPMAIAPPTTKKKRRGGSSITCLILT